jgi:uncharacterized protein YbcI
MADMAKRDRPNNLKRRIPMLEQQLCVWEAESRLCDDREVKQMVKTIRAQLIGLRTELHAWEQMRG